MKMCVLEIRVAVGQRAGASSLLESSLRLVEVVSKHGKLLAIHGFEDLNGVHGSLCVKLAVQDERKAKWLKDLVEAKLLAQHVEVRDAND